MKRSRRTVRVVLVWHRPLPRFPALVLCFAAAVLPPAFGAVHPDSHSGTQRECETGRVHPRAQVRFGEQIVDVRLHVALTDAQAMRSRRCESLDR